MHSHSLSSSELLRDLIPPLPRITQSEASRGARATSADEARASYASIKSTLDTATAKIDSDEELLQTLITGLSSSNKDDANAAGGYMGQLAEAKARLAGAGTEAEQAKMQIELAERELKDKEPRAKKAEREGEGLTKELAAARKEHDELTTAIGSLGWDEDEEKALLKRKAEVATSINGLLEVCASLSIPIPPIVAADRSALFLALFSPGARRSEISSGRTGLLLL